MTIDGLCIGFDLVEIHRIRRLLDRWGDRVLMRLLTPEERRYVAGKHSPLPHVAGLVAAKEACFKVLGVGPAQGVGWHDIDIGHSPLGAPFVATSGEASRVLHEHGATGIAVSISHERSIAGAVAVLLMSAPPGR